MRKALITLLLGGPLGVLPLSTALGDENIGLSVPRDPGWTTLSLPPVPHLETIHWLNGGTDFTKRPNVLGPHIDALSPFLLELRAPAMHFSSSAPRNESQLD